MRIIRVIKKNVRLFLENLLKEDDIKQDFQRNFSVYYSYPKSIVKKSI